MSNTSPRISKTHSIGSNPPSLKESIMPSIITMAIIDMASIGILVKWWAGEEFAPPQPKRGIYSPLGSLVPSLPTIEVSLRLWV